MTTDSFAKVSTYQGVPLPEPRNHLARLQQQQEQLGRLVRTLTRIQNQQANIKFRLENGRAVREQMKSEVMGAMADVRKVVDFDTPQQFKEMEQ